MVLLGRTQVQCSGVGAVRPRKLARPESSGAVVVERAGAVEGGMDPEEAYLKYGKF